MAFRELAKVVHFKRALAKNQQEFEESIGVITAQTLTLAMDNAAMDELFSAEGKKNADKTLVEGLKREYGICKKQELAEPLSALKNFIKKNLNPAATPKSVARTIPPARGEPSEPAAEGTDAELRSLLAWRRPVSSRLRLSLENTKGHVGSRLRLSLEQGWLPCYLLTITLFSTSPPTQSPPGPINVATCSQLFQWTQMRPFWTPKKKSTNMQNNCGTASLPNLTDS